MAKNIDGKFKKVYKDFIETYILRFLGLADESIREIKDEEEKHRYNNIEPITNNDGKLYFGNQTQNIFVLEKPYRVDDESINVANRIIQNFFGVSRYDDMGKLKNDYLTTMEERVNLEYAIQKGICQWVSEKKFEKIEELINNLESWSIRTYEGKKVPFGIVINDSVVNTDYKIPYLPFLKDEFSAVLSDGISSIIELDGDCNLIDYHSIYEDGIDNYIDVNESILPLRFAYTIRNFVTDNKVGIFLLVSGDIIIAKNRTIEFVKRNGSWLNFNIQSFKNSMRSFSEKNNLEEEILESTYSTALDVSFSHSGGIIAVVEDVEKLMKKTAGDKSILKDFDNLSKKHSFDSYDLTLDVDKDYKSVLKRSILLKLINEKTFYQLDRKLRSELMSMDGATIIDTKGKIISFGAIIQNDSGSSGGGRGAAAKKLSYYGFSIKISTDGYIEVYEEGKRRHIIK